MIAIKDTMTLNMKSKNKYFASLNNSLRSVPWRILALIGMITGATVGVVQVQIEKTIMQETNIEKKITEFTNKKDANKSIINLSVKKEKTNALVVNEGSRMTEENKEKWKCIDGIAFHRIVGGWENVPNAKCGL
ncbi:MAG TPA: hypothetical protein ACQGQX_05875 [Xylella taiwanensis]